MRHVFKLIFFLSCIIIPAFTPIVWSSCIGRRDNVGKLKGSTIWVVKDPEPRTMTWPRDNGFIVPPIGGITAPLSRVWPPRDNEKQYCHSPDCLYKNVIITTMPSGQNKFYYPQVTLFHLRCTLYCLWAASPCGLQHPPGRIMHPSGGIMWPSGSTISIVLRPGCNNITLLNWRYYYILFLASLAGPRISWQS